MCKNMMQMVILQTGGRKVIFRNLMSLQKKAVAYYNTYEIKGYPINGTLTLSENIADLGAVSCITEYALNKEI